MQLNLGVRRDPSTPRIFRSKLAIQRAEGKTAHARLSSLRLALFRAANPRWGEINGPADRLIRLRVRDHGDRGHAGGPKLTDPLA